MVCKIVSERWELIVNTVREAIVEYQMSGLGSCVFTAHQLKLETGVLVKADNTKDDKSFCDGGFIANKITHSAWKGVKQVCKIFTIMLKVQCERKISSHNHILIYIAKITTKINKVSSLPLQEYL